MQGEKLAIIDQHTIVEIQSLINVQGEFWSQKINMQVLIRPCRGENWRKINKRALHVY